MINEFIFFTIAVLDLTFILFVSRFGKSWINFAIIVNILLISTFGAKLVPLLGFTTNAGNVFYAAVFFATQLLVERYGKKEGYRSIGSGICAIILFVLMAQLIVRGSGVQETAPVNEAIATLFQAAPRIALASLVAYAVSQFINIGVFETMKRGSSGRRVWLRLNLSNAAGQLVDSLIFFTIAFYGTLPGPILLQAIIGGLIVKVAVGAISTPFFYAALLIPPQREAGEVIREAEEAIRQSEANLGQGAAQRKKVEATLTQKLAELEKTKAAMLNMMEDLEKSKVKDEAILASIGDGMVTVDKSEKIIQINRAAATMLGWAAKDALGQVLSTVIPLQNEAGETIPHDKRPVTLALHDTITTATVPGMQYYFVRRDGTRFPVTMVVTPVIVNDAVVGAIDVFRDTTQEKEISKAKNEFVSLASHQLRTPLAAIKWYTEMLLNEGKDVLTTQQREFGEQIMAGNQHMIELVSALLDVSRLDLGTFAIEPEAVDVVELVKSVVHDFEPDIERKRLEVKEEYGSVPDMSLDPRLMRIIVQNLVANAVQYTGEGGKITITAGVVGEHLRFTVEDTGVGIPAHQQSQVFSKLFRADNVRTIDSTGTGLGLYLVKAILDHVNGDVSFTSHERKGTTFTVRLPLSGMREKPSPKRLGH